MRTFTRTAKSRVAGVTAVLVAGSALVVALRPPPAPQLAMAGIAQDPCAPSRVAAVPAGVRGSYYPGSSVLRSQGRIYAGPGRRTALTAAESACVRTAVRASRGWLRSGVVPGTDGQQRAMTARALLDLRASLRPDGAVIAGWSPAWEYVWPRDSSWAAVALADTGHPAEALQIMSFLQRMQPRSGIWAARYLPGGHGPVPDGRPAELDADGWVPWAVWSWSVAARKAGDPQARQELIRLWPMVVAAADAATRALAADGLPDPAMDYWEHAVAVTLGTAAPLLAGLRAAADMAGGLGEGAEAQHWARAAARLSRGISAAFGRYGFPRLPSGRSGGDASVTFLGPPLADPGPGVRRAAAATQRLLREPNGGLRPGVHWPGMPGIAWTAETALFALFDAATGQRSRAGALLSWLAAHRTSLGALPEQVSAAGRPVSVAPLAWTDAIVVLAVLALTQRLPTVPLPAAGLA